MQSDQGLVLRFYGPVNQMGSCRARSVYLTTCLLGRLSPLSCQLPFLNQRKGENDHRKYFMINLHERMLPTSVGVEPETSWSPVGRRIQLSHRGQPDQGLCCLLPDSMDIDRKCLYNIEHGCHHFQYLDIRFS